MTVERPLGELLRLLPPNFYLKCQVEEDEDDEGPILCAVIMETPPEGGWTSPDQYFGATGYTGGFDRIKAWAQDDVPRVGISADPKDPRAFDRLTRSMLQDFLERKKLMVLVAPPQVEAPIVKAEPVKGGDPRTPKSLNITIDKQSFVAWVVPGQVVAITAGPHTISFQVPE